MPRYIFTIRSADKITNAEHAVILADDVAALAYACEFASELRKSSAHEEWHACWIAAGIAERGGHPYADQSHFTRKFRSLVCGRARCAERNRTDIGL
jgi:hypothetical protein